MPATMPFTDLLPDRSGERHRAYTWVPALPSENEFSPLAGVLTLTSARAHRVYRVEEFPADWFGRAFVLKKVDKSGFYSCFVSAEADQPDVCDCAGALAGHRCKHLEALHDLIRQDQI